MKKNILILLIFCFCLIEITGCIKQSDNKNDKYINAIEKYSKKYETLHNHISKAEYNATNNTLFNIEASGILSNVLYDLDEDGDYEGLSYTLDDNKIYLSTLKLKNDSIKEINTLELINLPLLDDFSLNSFIIKLNNRPYIFIEISGNSSLLSNGMYYYLSCFTIENNSIKKSNTINYEASFYNETEVNNYINKVKRFGLKMSDIKKSIVSQNENAVIIFEITRKHLKDFDSTNIDTTQNIQYGQDKIVDYFFENHILKLKNIKTKITTDNMEYEFKPGNIGRYEYKSNEMGKIEFEISKNGDEYGYMLGFYPKNSIHASEELWGTWDINKTEFIAENENTAALAEYKFKNIKYEDLNKITMDIELIKINNTEYKDYIIKDGTYTFTK